MISTIITIASIAYFVSLVLNMGSIKQEIANYVIKRGDKLSMVESLVITFVSNPYTLTPILVYVMFTSIPLAALSSVVALLINHIMKHGNFVK